MERQLQSYAIKETDQMAKYVKLPSKCVLDKSSFDNCYYYEYFHTFYRIYLFLKQFCQVI